MRRDENELPKPWRGCRLSPSQQSLQAGAVAMRRYYATTTTERHCPFAVRPRLEVHDVIDVHDRRPADTNELRRIELARQRMHRVTNHVVVGASVQTHELPARLE